MKLQELIKNVQQWSAEHGLDKGDSKKQLLKLYEGFGKLSAGISREENNMVKKGIGDFVMALIILGQQQDVEPDFSYLSSHTGKEAVHSLATAIGSLSGVFSISTFTGRGRQSALKIEFNHVVFYLKGVAEYQRVSLEDSLQQAWDEIKDRKGKLIDGVWVKEEDLPEV